MKASAVVLALLVAVVAVQGAETPLTWAPGQNFSPIEAAPGDTVKLTWTGLHGVWKLPTADCPASPDAPHTVVVEPVDSGTWTFTCNSTTTGDNWYGCPVDGHCAAGQKVMITCAA